MSGGRLVVLDRLGRDVKAFSLEEGLATIGSDPVCDIRVILPTVSPHHATVVVHTNQTVVRSVSAGDTLVNGVAVSVAALRHGDQVTIGGRTLRWEYNEPDRPRPLTPQPALVRRAVSAARGAQRRSHPVAQNVLVPEQRASMPGSSSGKQVAIVQPQRRDTSDKNVPASATAVGSLRGTPRRRSTLSRSRKSHQQPLRMSVLRAAVNLTKIQAPSTIDQTKQAAIMLMTGHMSKRPSPVRRTPNPPTTPKTPKTPAGSRKVSKGVIGVTPTRALAYGSKNETVSILEISDSNTPRAAPRRSGRNTISKSPHNTASDDDTRTLNPINDSESITYNSIDSASSQFHTPETGKTRFFNLAGSSTPYSDSEDPKSPVQSPLPSKHLSKTDEDNDVFLVEDCARDSLLESGDSPQTPRSPGSGSRTPILSIQNLLNQSSSTRGKRKTLPTSASSNEKPKLSVKSRSLGVISRRLQKSRKSSPPGNQTFLDEEIVTPKSAVKLVQEAVKNKHSTAKKPTSKRAIIDDLNESDLVKQLFNSPVKRKLSRSMTEFSRKELFEDDEVASLKHKRNTTALTERTPDNSLLNDTKAFTPDVFVSPISSPRNSHNLSGIRRLFRKNTPENDLRNVRGVKTLLRTPRNTKSIKNDLTNVSGVKKIFGKSPRNRLSDVRLKEVFAASPNNDLSQVWGVRSLFQSNKGRSPKNTLEDVRGVKKLFKRSSPRNDLTDVSGAKNVLRVNSPRNDLTEVRGVKDLYRKQEEKNSLSDLSGVQELFYEPSNLDSTFDLLVGKRHVRSYRRAKSFSKVSKHSKPSRNAKSLHCSIGSITNNVEEWLENELKKRTYNKGTPTISVTKSNLTLDLQKLSTDIVAGKTRLRTTRVRNNTSIAQQSLAANKTVSDLYSAHKLPIKKRRVLHSTPVKGGGAVPNDTIGARELGRVSPIQHLEPLHDSLDPKPSNRRGKVIENVIVEASKPSRRTRRKIISSPRPDRKTNTNKRRSSIVLKKKPPALLPKPTLKEEKVKDDVKKSPITRASTKQKRQVQPKIATPKGTTAKEISSVITKSSSQLNPRSMRSIKKNLTVQVKEVKTKSSESITNNGTSDKNAKKIELAPEQGVRKRGRKTVVITDEAVQKPAKRGRKIITAIETKEAGVATQGRRTRAVTETTRGKTAHIKAIETKEVGAGTQGRRTRAVTQTIKEKPNKITKEVIDTKDKENEAPNKSSRRTRQKTEVEESVDTKMTTRGRRAKNDYVPIDENKLNFKENTKATEIKSVEKLPPKTRRGAQTGNGEENKQTEGKNKEKKRKNKTDVVINEGRKTWNAAKEVEVKPSRGRKVTVVGEQKGATNDKKRGRKRKAQSVESPREVAVVEEKRRRVTRAQTHTGAQTPRAQGAAGRSRRR